MSSHPRSSLDTRRFAAPLGTNGSAKTSECDKTLEKGSGWRRDRRKLLARVATLLLMSAPGQAAENVEVSGEHPGWEQSGDLLQWGIPLVGFGLSFLLDSGSAGGGGNYSLSDTSVTQAPGLNWPGPRLGHSAQQDFLISFVRMEVATYGLKYSLNTPRPNGGSQSFPSGHTAAAFMGAEFIRKHYGGWWSAPAYLAASWVGYTRVESHNHYWGDVLGGALVGIAANYDFDGIDTPLGRLNFGPATFSPGFGGWLGQEALLTNAPIDLPHPVPGLRFELRF